MTPAAPVRGPRAVLDVAVQLVGRFGNLALGVVATIVVVRALGDDGFGQWATITAVVSITAAAGDLGIQSIAIRNAVADPEQESCWLGALLSLRLVLAVPLSAASAAAILLLATSSEMRTAGLLLAAGVLLSAPSAADAVFQLRVRNDVSIAIMTINSIVWTAAVVIILAAFVAISFGYIAGNLMVILELQRAFARVGYPLLSPSVRWWARRALKPATGRLGWGREARPARFGGVIPPGGANGIPHSRDTQWLL